MVVNVDKIVQVRLENDFVWEPVFKRYEFNEDAVKVFCKAHPEYYEKRLNSDGFCELIVEVRDEDKNVKKYIVLIDKLNGFMVKELEKIVL